MSRTREAYELIYRSGVVGSEEIEEAYNQWITARADPDGDPDETEFALELIERLMEHAGITAERNDLQLCDECDAEATEFWPNLKKPVQMCDSCAYNARRSGWEPGR